MTGEPTNTSPIEDLTFRTDYWDDDAATRAFDEFQIAIHGLDLTLWRKKGYWDEHYTPFSLFDGNDVVASVCHYSMNMIVNGQRRLVGQFSSVGTREPYRRRGLNRWLMDRAIEWASPSHDGFYLFADEDAISFYTRCGFVPVEETVVSVKSGRVAPRSGLKKLDMRSDTDLERVYRLAVEREPVSDLLGVDNPKLLMYHCLYGLRDYAYYIPKLDVAVFFKVDQGRLTLFDVVGPRIPAFAELHPYLARYPHGEVWFWFMPDKLGVESEGRRRMQGNNALRHPSFELPGPECLFPYSARA